MLKKKLTKIPGALMPVTLKQPDKVVLHYGNEQLTIQATDFFDGQIVMIPRIKFYKYKKFLRTEQKQYTLPQD